MRSIDWRVTAIAMATVHADEWIGKVEEYLRETGCARRAILGHRDRVESLDLRTRPVEIVSGLALWT
jgi:hypothetical protein